jgi:hypothetical protein
MALRSFDFTLSTTAQVIWTATHGDASQPQSVTVQNNQAIVVTVGDSGVTDGSDGLVLPDGSTTPTSVTVPMYQGDVLYGVAASGTPSVQVLVGRG